MKERQAAILKVDFKVLTRVLDFEGATVHRIYTPDEYLNPGYFCLVLEHPDLPVIKENERLSEITPIMQANYGEGGSLLSIERIEPKKLKSEG